jgi:hypothetical protein
LGSFPSVSFNAVIHWPHIPVAALFEKHAKLMRIQARWNAEMIVVVLDGLRACASSTEQESISSRLISARYFLPSRSGLWRVSMKSQNNLDRNSNEVIVLREAAANIPTGVNDVPV